MPFATSKRASIAVIAVCQVAAMAVWFSASAVTPALAAEFHLSNFAQAALTSGVQAGFVIGCLGSAFFGLPDRVDAGAQRDTRREIERNGAGRKLRLVVDQ